MSVYHRLRDSQIERKTEREAGKVIERPYDGKMGNGRLRMGGRIGGWENGKRTRG